ncbi:hypothetical protein CDAR_105761 [Caerostris darwini]|uniref:Secreted protein n=1 Tax=Caerostris darwini TaxID=1538125 RepID=A0AAV4TQL5_9ARAC|nr:hypothetical protein CDAR_105761 [Caerostris darwini]
MPYWPRNCHFAVLNNAVSFSIFFLPIPAVKFGIGKSKPRKSFRTARNKVRQCEAIEWERRRFPDSKAGSGCKQYKEIDSRRKCRFIIPHCSHGYGILILTILAG